MVPTVPASSPGDLATRWTWLDRLQVVVAVAALVLCFRGRGQQTLWLALMLLLPGIRCLASSAYRQRVRNRLQHLWATCGNCTDADAPLPWRAAMVFVVVPAGLLFLSNDRNLGTGDTWPVIPTAFSLVTQGNWNLDEYVAIAPKSYFYRPELPYCARRIGNAVYSSYPAGMVAFALPVTSLARICAADFRHQGVISRLEKWTAAWVAAFAVGVFFLIALHLAPPYSAWLSTLFLAAGSVMFSTCSQALWQHGGLIFWSLLALLVEFRHSVRPMPLGTFIQGLAISAMLACRLSAVLLVMPFALWLLVRTPRRALAVGVLAAMTYAPWAWMYHSIYGVPLASAGQLSAEAWSVDVATSLAGVLVSPARGVLVYQPWLLLGLLGMCVPWFLRRFAEDGVKSPAGWQWFCLAAIAGQLLLVAAWRCWWGGHCWGSRLVADVIPLAALLCVQPIALLCSRPAGRGVLACLLAVSFFVHASAVYWHADYWNNHVDVDHHPEMLWSWEKPPFCDPWQGR